MGYPWSVLYEWQPFKIDALGLITLLGAQEIDHAIGRLVPSRWLEYMPLLAGHVIAGDRFRQKKPAFNWYNVTSGIHTTDLAAWFSRWLMAQDFTPTRTVVWWEVRDQRRRRPGHQWGRGQRLDDKDIAALMSLCTMGVLIAMAVLSGDWYGFANGVALALSILVRAYIVRANRAAIDAAVERTLGGRFQTAPTVDDSCHVKTLMILPDSTAITVFVPETLIRTVFVCNPTPRSAMMYDLARAIGWVAFGVHIVALGMAQLVSQLCTVALLIVSTVLVCYRVGCDDFQGIWKRTNALQPSKFYSCWIGTYLQVTVLEWPTDADFAKDENGKWRRRQEGHETTEPASVRRQDLYAWLNLNAAEEESLAKWDLLPHARGYSTWVDDFNAKKDLILRDPIDKRSLVMRQWEQRGGRASGSGGGRNDEDEEKAMGRPSRLREEGQHKVNPPSTGARPTVPVASDSCSVQSA
jgi:hypothetical protein